MTFTKKSANTIPLHDEIFSTVALAKQDIKTYGKEVVTNATIGSLYGEDNTLVAFESVFHHYDEISSKVKAAYGSIAGTDLFKKTVYDWVTENKCSSLEHSVIASVGGTGSISSLFSTFLEEGETIIYPEIGWSNYELIASQNNLQAKTYQLFEDDHFNLNSVKEVIHNLQSKQEKIVFVINDPCHNPTGYSLTNEEWKELIQFLNEVSQTNPVIVINDIAYIDFSNNLNHSRDYMKNFEDIKENVLICLSFSCSKTLTSYGLRSGATIILGKDAQAIKDVTTVSEKYARSTWSNSPNGAMENFIWVINENKDAYLKEKETYINLIKQRSDLFIQEANACGLELYPYKEGFFVTLKIEDTDYARKVKEAFIKEHIFTVVVKHGIRVAVCSLPIEKCKGLASKMKAIMNTVK